MDKYTYTSTTRLAGVYAYVSNVLQSRPGNRAAQIEMAYLQREIQIREKRMAAARGRA